METEPEYTVHPDDYSVDDYSIADSFTEGSENKPTRDPAYHKMKVGPKYNQKTVEFYDTGCVMGSSIRYASSGFRTSHKVGSRDQDLYFKVVNTAHPTSSSSKKVRAPCHLYYESPEQWEKHFHTVCPEDVKDAWREKYNRALSRIMRA